MGRKGNLKHIFYSLKPFSEKFKSRTGFIPKRKVAGPDRYTDKFYQTFMEEIIPIFYNGRFTSEVRNHRRNFLGA